MAYFFRISLQETKKMDLLTLSNAKGSGLTRMNLHSRLQRQSFVEKSYAMKISVENLSSKPVEFYFKGIHKLLDK